ncbi:MAG: DUF4105 domain-containing protein [Bacteroides sp.]|nr:DUF4105 domain-containing protein [Bacteroides sp.]MCM1413895.1 DUF4105 domain-containing protein [Bacteroides sp.]
MNCRATLIILFCVLALFGRTGAQQRILPEPDPADTTLSVGLITCAPGSQIYELEGHSGLRLRYSGIDVVVNWGLFDFASPGFVYRFVKGETDYSIGISPTPYFLLPYQMDGRKVTEQTLNLTTVQKVRLIEAVETNLKPANRIYRYNYVKDNCATRPLAIIEQAVGCTIEMPKAAAQLGPSPTYRSEMRYFHANYPWYQLGIDIALGCDLDKTIDRRATIFAPVILEQLLSDATIILDGRTQPLVVSTTTIIDDGGVPAIENPTPWYATPLCVMTLLLVVSIVITIFDRRRHCSSRWFDAILFTNIGFAGIIVAFLVFISTHEASSPNWILLWLNPLAFCVILFQWSGKTRKIVRIYHAFNTLAIIVLAIIFLCGIQIANPAFYPAMAATIIRSINYLIPTYRH